MNKGHTYGTVKDTMDVIKTEKKEHLNTLEKLYIYTHTHTHTHKISRDILHVNDTLIILTLHQIAAHIPIHKATSSTTHS
jgi:hypothetical protein